MGGGGDRVQRRVGGGEELDFGELPKFWAPSRRANHDHVRKEKGKRRPASSINNKGTHMTLDDVAQTSSRSSG